jgi:DNA-binding MarR family transcriptional regulator
MLVKQVEEKLNLEMTTEEMTVLEIINNSNGRLHQRDLAKLIFKDRANTGKLLNSLEESGYITRKSTTKNKRQVKLISITEKGLEQYLAMKKIMEPIFMDIENQIPKQATEDMKNYLNLVRKIIQKSIELHI